MTAGTVGQQRQGERMLGAVLSGNRRANLIWAGALIAAFAVLDWRVQGDMPLGFLYLLPMLLLGKALKPWQTGIAAILCTYLTEEFDPFAWTMRTGLPRDVLYSAAFFFVGVFVYELDRSRQIILAQLREIQQQRDARHEAEEQLTILIESSPAAIITADSDGTVLMANEAAHRMLGLNPASLLSRSIYRYFPALQNISDRTMSQPLFRTVMQSRGRREDGEGFLAEICFSTYHCGSGVRLAAMILDSSEEFRTREESSLHQMLAGSRIAVSAVSHEIRNVCGAIAVVHRNLSRNSQLAEDKDFEALGNLAVALERIAAVDLRPYPDQATEVDLRAVLDDLRIVIAPSTEDKGIHCVWKLDPKLPPVWADSSNLMQVLLNLTTNSIRTLAERSGERRLTVSAKTEDERVVVEVLDNGGGVAQPSKLFYPFQPGAQSTGLGLYLARAFARSFGGDVRYKGLSGSACFVVELAPVLTPERIDERRHSHFVD
jgi:two-component system, LuxR family, sensor kinase FixL